MGRITGGMGLPGMPGLRSSAEHRFMAGLIAPVARLIEEFNKPPRDRARRPPSGSRITSCAPRPTTPARWPARSSRSRRRSPTARPAATSPRRSRPLRDLRRSAPRRDPDLRGRGAPRRAGHRADRRVPRPLPRPARRDQPHGRHRSGADPRPASCRPVAEGGAGGGHPRHQPEPRGRGDRDVPRRPARRLTGRA